MPLPRSRVGSKSKDRDYRTLRVALNLQAAAIGSANDHGALTGLGDDDHSQYAHRSQNETITGQYSFDPSSVQAPFFIGSNAQGQLVTGLKADQLNKQVIAGDGLTGGGFLTADRTLDVGAGDGITVNGDDVSLTTPANNLGVSSVNAVASDGHTHAIDSSPSPGAAAAILATTGVGQVDIHDLRAGPNADPDTQFRVQYDASKYAAMKVSSDSDLQITTQGSGDIRLRPGGTGHVWGDSSWIIGADAIPPAILTVRDTTEPQVRVDYDEDNYASFSVASDGHLLLQTIGTDADMTISPTQDLLIQGNDVNIDPSASVGITPGTFVTIDPVAGNVTLAPQGNYSVRLEPTGNVFLDPGGTLVNPLDSYEVNLGQINKKYLTLHVAELWAETLVAQETIATIGGRILVGPTSRLARDLTSSDTTIYVEHNQMSNGDIVYLEKNLRVEFIKINSAYTASPELLSNIGFEAVGGGGADIWANWNENAGDGTLANTTININGGSDAARLISGVSSNTHIYQDAAVSTSTRYKLTFWARGDGTYAGRFKIVDQTNGIDIIALRSTGQAAAGYWPKRIYFTTPANCTTVRIYFYCPDTSAGVAYFDDDEDNSAEHMLMKAEYSYTVIRNLDGTGANDWHIGDAVFNTGGIGDGFIDLYSLSGVNAASTAGPTIVGNVRYGTTFNQWNEHWAIGNLNGIYGQGAVYGAAFGEYANNKNHMVITGNSIKFYTDQTTLIASWIDETITLGNISNENVILNSTSITLNQGTTSRIKLMGTGNLYIGSNTDVAGSGVSFAVFTTAFSNYGSSNENMGAGDILIGDNSAGSGNILWDASDSSLLFRNGTTDYFEIDLVYGDVGKVAILMGANTQYVDQTGFIIPIAGSPSFASTTQSGIVLVAGGTPSINGETLAVGDVIIGSNNTSFAGLNVFYDASVKELYFRQGQGIHKTKIDYFGRLVGGTGEVRLGLENMEFAGSSTITHKWYSANYVATITWIDQSYTDSNNSAWEICGVGNLRLSFVEVSGVSSLQLRGQVRINTGLHVGDVTNTATDNDLRVVKDIVCGGGIYANSGAAGVGEPSDGHIWASGDMRCSGGLTVGNITTDASAGMAIITGGLRVGDTAAPATGVISCAGDVRMTGGLSVGSSSYNAGTGYGQFSKGLVVGVHDTTKQLDNAIYIANKLYIYDTANSKQTRGITIRQATSGTNQEAISLKDDNVNHALTGTNLSEFDTYGHFRSVANTVGGLIVTGLTEQQRGLILTGYVNTEDSSYDNDTLGAVEIQAARESSNNLTALSGAATVFVVRNHTTTNLQVKGNGGLHIRLDMGSGSMTSNVAYWDEYDDIKLLTAARALTLPAESDLRNKFADWINYARPILESTGVIHVNDGRYGNGDDGSVFMHVQGMDMLIIDTIRQLHNKMELMETTLLEAGIEVPQLNGDSK